MEKVRGNDKPKPPKPTPPAPTPMPWGTNAPWTPDGGAKGNSLGDPGRDIKIDVTPTTYTSAPLFPGQPGFVGPVAPGASVWKDKFTPNAQTGTWNWGGNPGALDANGNLTAIDVSLLGDKTGNPIPTRYGIDQGFGPGSPQALDEARNQILKEFGSKKGGILELKQKLADLNYLQGKQALTSLATGDQYDNYFGAALTDAINSATSMNVRKADAGATSFLSFQDWLAVAAKLPDTNSFGSGAQGGTTIVHQKFRPEDYDIAIDQLFQQTIGRGATDEELNQFVSTLQKYDKTNPQKTVTTVNGQTTVSTQSGGVDQNFAMSKMRDQALESPEAKDYNQGTKYLQYFMDALNSPIQLG